LRFPHNRFLAQEMRVLTVGWCLSVPCALQISNIDNHLPVLLNLSSLVLGASSQLERISVLVEAREVPTISGGRSLDIVNGIVRHQDRDERRTIAH